MATTTQNDANRGTNDTNEGIYVNVVDASVPNAYDFDDDDASYIIDVRGRSLCGAGIVVSTFSVDALVSATTSEFESLANLVSADFDYTIEAEQALATGTAPKFVTVDLLTEADNFIATAVLIQFKNTASDSVGAITGIIRALNK